MQFRDLAAGAAMLAGLGSSVSTAFSARVDLLTAPFQIVSRECDAEWTREARPLVAELEAKAGLEIVSLTDTLVGVATRPGASFLQYRAKGGRKDQLDFVEVDYRALFPGFLTLVCVVREGNDQRSFAIPVAVSGSQGAESGWERCRFDLREHVAATARLHRLELRPPDLESQPFSVTRVRLHRGGVAARGSVDLAQQRRESLVLAPGAAVQWTLPIPAAGVLRFSYGLRDSHRPHRQLGGDVVLEVGESHEERWRASLDSRAPATAGDWLHAEVDLREWAGQTIDLRLRHARETADTTATFVATGVALAEPRLVGANASAPLVVLVTLDTTRADRLGLYGYPRDVSPRLDALARESVVFESAFATGTWTHPSTATMLTGFLPPQHGLGANDTEDRPFYTGVRTLAHRLTEAGMATGVISGNRIVTARDGFARGMHVFDEGAVDADRDSRAPEVVARAEQWLRRHTGEPGFLYVHFFDPHDPYQAPAPDTRRYVHEPQARAISRGDIGRGDVLPLLHESRRGPIDSNAVEVLSDLYDGEIRFLDAWVGRLLDIVDLVRERSNTTVMIVADHGEEFLDHGSLQHKNTLYDEIVRVPFLLRPPGPAFIGRREKAAVSLLDVAPTVTAALGLPASNEFLGRDLMAARHGALSPRPVFAISYGSRGMLWDKPQFGPARMVVDGRWKYIWNRDRPAELFDRERDPHEKDNLATRDRDRVARMQVMIDTALVEGTGAGIFEVDPELRDRLRSLGYID